MNIRFILALAFALSAGVSGAALAGESTHEDHGHHHAQAHRSAAGKPGTAAAVNRTIAVAMFDTMRYEPSSINVKAGETIRFTVKNRGSLTHEFGIGTLKEQKAHAEMMKSMPDMKHDDPGVITVEPGQTRELIWTFSKSGGFQIACHIPGHYEAGMKATVKVRR
ncbi:MAG: cupredoxin family protein [Burkholderiales bacterium]